MEKPTPDGDSFIDDRGRSDRVLAGLRTTIPILNMLREMKDLGFPVVLNQRELSIHCAVFGDNSGVLKIATIPKMRPRTKHINKISISILWSTLLGMTHHSLSTRWLQSTNQPTCSPSLCWSQHLSSTGRQSLVGEGPAASNDIFLFRNFSC
jgi:hypothetical protein